LCARATTVDLDTYIIPAEEDLASEEAMWALYEQWCAFYGERSRDDMLRQFRCFKDKAHNIHEFNKSGASYTRELTKRADHTADERARFLPRRGRCF
jgi:hypothetical protein